MSVSFGRGQESLFKPIHATVGFANPACKVKDRGKARVEKTPEKARLQKGYWTSQSQSHHHPHGASTEWLPTRSICFRFQERAKEPEKGEKAGIASLLLGKANRNSRTQKNTELLKYEESQHHLLGTASMTFYDHSSPKSICIGNW